FPLDTEFGNDGRNLPNPVLLDEASDPGSPFLPSRHGSVRLGRKQGWWLQFTNLVLVEIGVVRVGGIVAIRSRAQVAIAEARSLGRMNRGGIWWGILRQRCGRKTQRGK